MRIAERVHTFGAGNALVGIVSLPDGDDGAIDPTGANRPFIVLLNAGLVHRVGPFRMGVELSRRLAACGFRVLRFDQSGLGDSLSRPGSASVGERALLDGREAMDFLRSRYGARRFVVGGLCSGAMNAHRICQADDRVVGMWMLDGYAYPSPIYYRHLILRKLRRPRTWVASARSLVNRAKSLLAILRDGAVSDPAGTPADGGDGRQALFFQDWPAQSDARAEIQAMLRRGARMLFVYTGGWSSFVAEEQFDEMFPRLERRDQITVRYQPHGDHTYLAIEHREAMFRNVEDFVRDFAAEGPRTA